MDVKEILYASIENHKKYIVSDIAQGKSHDIIDSICKECIPVLENSEENKSEILGSFAEGLVHYLLTEALIPSQRKITIDNMYVDIVIPDTRTLKSNPQDVLLIIFPKTSDVKAIRNRIAELERIQPNRENIWLILENHAELETRTYNMHDNEKNPFSGILNDIIGFLTNRKQSKLKLFRI